MAQLSGTARRAQERAEVINRQIAVLEEHIKSLVAARESFNATVEDQIRVSAEINETSGQIRELLLEARKNDEKRWQRARKARPYKKRKPGVEDLLAK